jgi:hypothetical protein
METELRQLANIPDDYSLEFYIQSFFMCEIGYRILKIKKTVEILLYKGWFPESYEDSKEALAEEIKNKMGW